MILYDNNNNTVVKTSEEKMDTLIEVCEILTKFNIQNKFLYQC